MTHVKDSVYFSHDSNARRDPKILALRSVYGMEGYGWYWTLIEILREQPGYKLSIDSKYAYKAIAMELECDEEAATKFVQDCIKEFGLFASDEENFWSESLLRRMEIKEVKSTKAREAALARWGKSEELPKDDATVMHTHSEKNSSNASKVKESKVNEIKDKDINARSVPDSRVTDAGFTNDFERFWSVYPASRRTEKKAAYRAWKARLKAGANPEQIITAARNYAQDTEGKEPRYIKLPKTFLGPDTPYEDLLKSRGDPGHQFTHVHPDDDLQQAIQRKTKLGKEDTYEK